MTTHNPTSRNWFDQGGQAYARFRPEYPASLAHHLATQAPDRHQAVDVGCGNGQLTVQLAEHFADVIGIDPSADQIANATPHDHARYICAPAEKLPIADNTINLITAAQAAHWFDLPAFYDEARRIAAKDAVIALISYGVMQLPDHLQSRFDHFYTQEIGPYWPAERKLVDSGYRGLDFPFGEIEPPAMAIQKNWNLADVLGYISTWSAVRRASEAGQAAILTAFAQDMSDLWGDPRSVAPVSWPIAMRIGRI